MRTDKDIKRELEEKGFHHLAGTKKETGYKVPEGFFEELSKEVFSLIENGNPDRKAVATKFFSIRLVSSLAAGLLILAIVAYSLFFVSQTKQNGVYSQFDDNEVEEYFASLNEFDRMLVTDYVLQLDVEGFNADQEGFYDEDESLLDYLFDEINYQRFDPLEMLENNK